MKLTIPSLEVATDHGKRHFPGDEFALPSVLTIQGSDCGLAEELLRLALGLPRADEFADLLTHENCALRPPLDSHQASYVSAYPPAEVSRFWTTVREEIMLQTQNRTVPHFPSSIVSGLGLSALLERSPRELSGGETARVILASHCRVGNPVLLVDNILSELDIPTRREFCRQFLDSHESALLIVMDHLRPAWPSRIWNTDEEPVFVGASVHDGLGDRLYPDESLTIRVDHVAPFQQESSLTVDTLSASRGGRTVFDALSFEADSGDLVWAMGPNGCGKSTLFEGLLGWLSTTGTVRLRTNSVDQCMLEAVSYAPQHAEADVTELTLRRELQTALKTWRAAQASCASWVEELGIPAELLDEPLKNAPELAKLASVLSCLARPGPVFLLDEPTLMLPRNYRQYVTRAMHSRLGTGGIILCASHDAELYAELSD